MSRGNLKSEFMPEIREALCVSKVAGCTAYCSGEHVDNCAATKPTRQIRY
jgi:hypothetical protein